MSGGHKRSAYPSLEEIQFYLQCGAELHPDLYSFFLEALIKAERAGRICLLAHVALECYHKELEKRVAYQREARLAFVERQQAWHRRRKIA